MIETGQVGDRGLPGIGKAAAAAGPWRTVQGRDAAGGLGLLPRPTAGRPVPGPVNSLICTRSRACAAAWPGLGRLGSLGRPGLAGLQGRSGCGAPKRGEHGGDVE